MSKSNIYVKISLIFLVIISFVIIPLAYSKYYKDITSNVVVKSTPFYFETTASDLNITYSVDAHFSFLINNYDVSGYTEKDINYIIKWSNDTYALNINGSQYDNVTGEYKSTLIGGKNSSDTINIKLAQINEKKVSENMTMSICTTAPYEKCENHKITIISPDGYDIVGNPTNWTKDDVVLQVVPKEGNDQIRYCSFDDGSTWQDAVYASDSSSICSKTFFENQLVKVKVKNSDGAISETTDVEITKIDKEPPILTFDYIDKDTNDQTLIVTLGDSNRLIGNMTYEDKKSGIKEVITTYNGNLISDTNEFLQVGRYLVTYKAIDNIGNEKEYLREILVRWDVGGRYILQRQEYVGTGSSNLKVGSGLWKDTIDTGYDPNIPYSSKYYYSGKTVNNYVAFANTTFRVVNIAENDTVKLIAPLSAKSYGYEAWYSKLYKTSFYKSWSGDWIPNNRIYDEKDSNKIEVDFTSDNSHIDNATFYAGVMSRDKDYSILDIINEERTNDAKIAGGTSVDFKSKVALPTVSDYLKANGSLDVIYNIRKSQLNSKDFRENSWLGSDTEQFTMTGCPGGVDNDFWVLYPNVGNEILSRTGYYNQKVRAIIYLKNDTILSGTGTETDPFIPQYNWNWFYDMYPTQLYNKN